MKKWVFIFSIILLISTTDFSLSSSRVDELQEQINLRNQEIEKIQEEIKKSEEEIDKLANEEKTLKNQITQLETTAKKLKSEINLTEKQINNADSIIEKLGFEIEGKTLEIYNKKDGLAEIIRAMDEEESKSLLEILLAHNSLSEFFDNIERMQYLQKDINFTLAELKNLKIDLEEGQREKETEKNNLEQLYIRLADQKQIAEYNKTQKDILLVKTKNKESIYRELLSEQVEKQKALTEEILALEEEIRVIIDPDSLPPVGLGILKWPLDEIKITQEFGWTPFAKARSWLYPKIGHNGVDFRASEGTPVKAAMYGIVTDTGNTDLGCWGVSYGKWILIEHPNNLSTFYAHLSKMNVSKGEQVKTGQIIGYSGNTGVTYGPHLHFGVFATQAVEITLYKSRVCGTNMKLPLVALNGYLNPLDYL